MLFAHFVDFLLALPALGPWWCATRLASSKQPLGRRPAVAPSSDADGRDSCRIPMPCDVPMLRALKRLNICLENEPRGRRSRLSRFTILPSTDFGADSTVTCAFRWPGDLSSLDQ